MRWAYICPVCDTAMFYMEYLPVEGTKSDPEQATFPNGTHPSKGDRFVCAECGWAPKRDWLMVPAGVPLDHFMEVDE